MSINSIGRLPIKLVAPITGWKANFSGKIWLVNVQPNSTNGLTKVSAVDALQIKGVDVQRFRKKRGRFTATLMEEIGAAIVAIIDYQ
jgi:mRNA interferase MazF